MRSVLLCVLLGACGSDEGKGKDGGIDGECDVICPDGTRSAGYDAVARGEAQAVVGTECETICEPIVPCSPPNVVSITPDGYSCAPLEGYVDVPADADVDFSWADQWVQP